MVDYAEEVVEGALPDKGQDILTRLQVGNTPLISPFADSINSGLNNAIFAEPAASGGADFNALEQALQTDPVQAHPRRRRGRKPAR